MKVGIKTKYDDEDDDDNTIAIVCVLVRCARSIIAPTNNRKENTYSFKN